jgi:hypothetical protein
VLVATPQRAARLLTLATTALHEFYAWNEEEAERCATDLINSLLEKGWLERVGLDLVSTRDSVVDEVLEGVLRQQQAPQVRRSTLFYLLSAGLQSPQTLGRLMTSLGRLVAREPKGNPFEQEVLEALDLWFERHSVEMSQALLDASEDVSSYALGAVGSGHLGGQLLARHWEALLRPWLERSGRRSEARHLFHRCLQWMPPGEPVTQALLTAALRWLDLHGGSEEASFVIGPLLWREDLGAQAPECLHRARQWLELHAEKEDAFHLLSPLLMGPEQRGAPPISRLVLVEGQTARLLVECAVRWLAAHDQTRPAGQLLWKLLRRGERAEGTASCLPHAIRWLEANHLASGASYLLRGLLMRTDLEAHASVCIEYALWWLETHGLSEQASFVLSALLCRDDLQDAERVCLAHARRWLEAHPHSPNGFFISRAVVLQSPKLEALHAQVQSLGQWLQARGARQEAAVLIQRLLTYKKFESLVTLCEEPLSGWLKAHAQTLEDGVFLGLLLRRRHKTAAKLVFDQVLRWLELHGRKVQAHGMLQSILSSKLRGGELFACRNFILDWLEMNDERLEAGLLLGTLMCFRRGDQLTQDLMARLMGWMERHGQRQDAFTLVHTLLRSNPQGPLRQACLEWSGRWMQAHERSPEALTISSALAQHMRSEELPEALFEQMLRSLALHPWHAESYSVLSLALVKTAPGAASALIPLALGWLEVNGETDRAGLVLKPLMSRTDLGEHLGRCLAFTLHWLDRNGTAGRAIPVLQTLLGQHALGEWTGECLGRALQWLDAKGTSEAANVVLHSLLQRKELAENMEGWLVYVLRYATAHSKHPGTLVLLETLFECGGWVHLTASPSFPALLENALHCMREQPHRSLVPTLLISLLVHADLREGAREPVVEQARSWLATQKAMTEPSKRVRECLERTSPPTPMAASS